MKPVVVVLHVLFFSWKNNNMADDSDQLDCLLQALSLNLNVTILQSIYLIFLFCYYLQSLNLELL